jgi:hypothetical protein
MTRTTCNSPPASAYLVGMRKVLKVVPITQPRRESPAVDQTSHRVILAIGSRCIALDFITRITELPPTTASAPVLLMKKNCSSMRK